MFMGLHPSTPAAFEYCTNDAFSFRLLVSSLKYNSNSHNSSSSNSNSNKQPVQ